MSEPIGLWRATYTPGDWAVLAGPTSLVILGPEPTRTATVLNDLWGVVVQADSLERLVQQLAQCGVEKLPDFAAFFWHQGQMRSLVRGALQVRDLQSGVVVATGEGVQTWTETGFGQVRRVRVVMQEHAGLDTKSALPLVVGAVTASTVDLDATAEARVSTPQKVAPVSAAGVSADDQSGPPAAQLPPAADHAGPAADQSELVSERAGLAQVAPPPSPPDLLTPDDQVANPFGGGPWGPPGTPPGPPAPHLMPGAPHPFGQPPGPRPFGPGPGSSAPGQRAGSAYAPPNAPTEAFAPGYPPQPPGNPQYQPGNANQPPQRGPQQPPAYGQQAPAYGPGQPGPWPPGGQGRGEPNGDLVLAVTCPQNHPNPPEAQRCRRCGGPLQGQPRMVPRPVLALLRPSAGAPVEVDRTVLIGRSPQGPRVGREQLPRLLAVPSPSHDISRTHLKVSPEAWELLATDLHSTNGTQLIRPGHPEPERMTPGQPVPVYPGCVLDLGDGVTILVDHPV